MAFGYGETRHSRGSLDGVRRPKLALARRAVGLSQEKFAEVLGVHPATVRRWEAGTSEPQAIICPRMERVLDVSRDELKALLQVEDEPVAGDIVRVSQYGVDQFAVVTAQQSGSHYLLGLLDHTRLLVDRTLMTGLVPGDDLGSIEDRIADHVVTYTRTPPLVVLQALAPDLLEVQTLAAQRQSARVQARLSEATAVLGLLSADALMKLGEIGRAKYWYGTARMAADDTTNLELRARVRAQEAMLPYYYGNVQDTVRLAQEAQALLPRTPCDAVALAAAAEARALARLGDHAGAERAMRVAEALVDQLDEPPSDAAFRFNDKRLLLYLSGTLTYMGEFARARRVQEQALERYRSEPELVIDPALIRLDQAVSEASRGDAEGASMQAIQTLQQLPPAHRTSIVLTRALDVVAAIPSARRQRPAVAELRALATNQGSTA
ncbi:MAG TPA: helix-turn-helix transcriptional regulator [Kribbella sp.]